MKIGLKYLKYLEWVLMMVLLLGIVVISKEMGFLDTLKPESRTGKGIMFIGIVFMSFLVLAVHELGHLITGLLNGFRFELFVVGPLGIKREEDRIKIYLNKNIGYYGGVAATSPIEDGADNAKKFARLILAGPVASVFFAIFCFVISFAIGKPLGIIFYTGGLISIAIFFATTIPSKSGMFFTDRKRYQRLVRPGKDQQVELAILRIMGKYSKDNSYKNVDRKDIAVLVEDELPFIQYYGLFNLICYQMENEGLIDDETNKDYEKLSKKMSKSVVLSFNSEIENVKGRWETGSIK